jgi:FtsH-binding integral membrane protein
MSNFPQDPVLNYRARDEAYVSTAVVSRFMSNVYAWMCVGLATTALVAWYVASQPSWLRSIYSPGTFIVLLIVELGLVWAVAGAIQRISAGVATALFVLYSAINGATLAFVFVVYDLPTVGTAFAVTAGMFGVISVIGFVTKRDLSGFGSFLFMALIGLVIASVVNLFVASSALYWITTYAGVLIFLGLTVYDTNKLKQWAYATEGDQAMAQRLAIVGSLSLYLDFINLFLLMLRLLAKARE